MFKSMKSRVLSGSALLLAVSVALGVAMAPDDQAAAIDNNNQSAEIRVGTFDPQMAFQQYHRISELVELQQRLEQEAQQAQMAGDQQRLMQLSQEMQDGQMRVINAFQEDVDRAMPEVAREAGVQIVAVEIVYTDERFGEPQDLTQELVAEINPESTETEQDNQAPAFPMP